MRDAQGRPFVRVQTLGTAIMLCGEVRIGPTAGILFALLLRLTHAPGMQLGREALLESLWPGQPEARRRANLRQALYKLRSHGIRVRVKGGCASIDAAQVVRTFAVERTAVRFERDVVAGQEPFGAFLPGFVSPCGTFEEWVQDEREAVHAEVRRVLVGQLRGRRERADWSGADVLARWLLQFDPLNEDATLTLAECTMLTGSKAEAIAILDRYLEELGPAAGDIRLPATQLRRRFSEPPNRRSLSFVATERHFVGRESVIAELTLSMRRARWRDGNAVLLHGASGIGKTRVTVELGKVAIVEGFRELRCDCCESDVTRPLSIFIDLLPELLLLPGALGCSPTSLAALRRLVPESPAASAYASSIAAANASSNTRATHGSAPSSATSSVTSPLSPLLPMVDVAHTTAIGDATAESSGDAPSTLPFATPIAPIASAIGAVHDALEDARQSAVTPLLPDGMSGDTLAPVFLLREPLPMVASLRRAIIDLLAAIADEKPIVIVVDDAHWMDAGSWDVLSDLIERMNGLRVFVLMMSRSPYGRPTRPERIPLALDVRPLAPLTPEASARLAALIASDMSALLNPMLSEWFVTTSEGSPLFLRALVNHWIETGDAGGIPPTLTQAIEQRLAKLSPDAMRTLQAMALLGVFASVDRIRAVLEYLTHQLLASIEELTSIGTFRPYEPDIFRPHELLGLASLKRLSLQAGQLLNLRIGEELSRDLSDPSGAGAAKAIGHFLAASADTKAIQFVLQAGYDYISRGLPTAALALCERTAQLQLNAELSTSVRALEMESLYQAGRFSRFLAMSKQIDGCTSSGAEWDASNPRTVLAFIESARHSGVVEEDFDELCARALLLAERTDIESAIRFEAVTVVLRVATHGLSEMKPIRAYEIGTEIHERGGIPDHERARLDMYFHTAFGDAQLAQRAAFQLRARFFECCTPKERVSTSGDVAYTLRVTGASQEAKSIFEAMHLEGQLLGMTTSASLACWYLALIALDTEDDLEASHRWIERAERVRGALDETLLRYLCEQHRARLGLDAQDLRLAARHIASAKRLESGGSNPRRAAYTCALDLGAAVLEQSREKVEAHLTDAQSRFIRLWNSLGQDYLASQIVLALRFCERHDEAAVLLSDYQRVRRERSSLPRFLARSLQSTTRLLGSADSSLAQQFE